MWRFLKILLIVFIGGQASAFIFESFLYGKGSALPGTRFIDRLNSYVHTAGAFKYIALDTLIIGSLVWLFNRK